MRFDDLLIRADDETLQDLLGKPAVRLLALLDPQLAKASALRALVTSMREVPEILRDSAARAALLDLLPKSQMAELARALGTNRPEALGSLALTRGSDREQRLFEFFGVLPPSHDSAKQSEGSRTKASSYGLFRHQRDAVRRVRAHLLDAPRRVLLHMPTGAGKTRTAMHVVADHLKQHEPTLVVWLAYSEELCEQAAHEFEDAWTSHGDRDLSVHRFWGDQTLSLEGAIDGFAVVGLGKIYASAVKDINFLATMSDRTSLVIIDEAHQAVAETYSFVLRVFADKNPTTALIGLTATPGRSWNRPGLDEQLAEFFGRRKVTLQVEGHTNPIDYLIAEGYLARPHFKSLIAADKLHLSVRELDELSRALDIPTEILERLAANEQRNLQIVTCTERLLRTHRRILLFAATVSHSRLLATVLRARGHWANSIDSTTSSSERERLVGEFRDGTTEPKILCNYGVLAAGFDAPQTSAAVIARPTKSLVLFSQMVGRVTRGPRAGGNSDAEIVTVVDTNLPGFGNVGEAFHNWEDVWQ